MIGRLIRWTLGLLVLASIGEMIAAFITKQRTPSVGDADSDEIALVTIFEPLEFTSTATAFRGGSLLCWYGGGDLDLRDASLDPDGAHLTVKVIMGGGRVLVPDEWIVETHVAPILGGVADPAKHGSGRPMRRGSSSTGSPCWAASPSCRRGPRPRSTSRRRSRQRRTRLAMPWTTLPIP